MTRFLFLFALVNIFACSSKSTVESSDHILPKNILSSVDTSGFRWMNRPQNFNFSGGTLEVTVDGQTDFFNNPENLEVSGSAPFYYKSVEGDFVASLLVEPDFSDLWNAGALMVHIDSARWIKFAFENSDATGKSIVSVVTQGASDDANGVMLGGHHKIWLRIIRKDNNYSMHWSTDGFNYTMTRLTHIPYDGGVNVGIEAQCPDGSGAIHRFHHFSVEPITVDNLREGTIEAF